MNQLIGQQRPPLTAYEDLAGIIDHALVRAELSDSDIREGCRIAAAYKVASVIVRPSDLEQAIKWMEGTGVPVGTVAGFPQGSSTTASKLYETEELLRKGACEIDAVINIGKVLSRDFRYVERELSQLSEKCHEAGRILKIIFENAYLTKELKIAVCEIATAAGVDYVKTSTGFAGGCTIEDLRLMRAHTGPAVGVKAAGGIRTLDMALRCYEAGSSRIGATATAAILDEWKIRVGKISG